ncbi:accessory Sec system S-layer assembly protein [Bacillus sp. FJAT-29790]|uniref:accessory Sec system S-layer assembly protein n=1 Tax=Bacillus sp. FJAT-29790 TaxID=1895002 RepID=UPI001C23DFA5|nr:accessory Sec system S-layer assembly protein [Bacillus sp. FJAT-29790]MBU8881105.1 accessory Sec system S-layer assembly protein [Bacillus sp. FJAT-29790]
MFGLFNRKDKMEKQGTDSSVDSKELLGEEEASSDREVKTALSFPPEAEIGQEERYYFQFLNNELPLLKENQISLSGIELKKEDGKLYVTAFVRNSLAKGIQFEKDMPLMLIGPNGETLARQHFDLSQLGELPAESSRPWPFIFEESNVFAEEIPQTDWKLAFELKKEQLPHSLDLAESWEKSLADADKEKLAQLVQNITPPKAGEVNFMGIQAHHADDGTLHITMLIRNGGKKNLTLQQLPLIVEDAAGDLIAKGGFALDNFEVKANTSKPWTFIFPKELVLKEKPDLSKWKAFPPQK